MNQGQTTRTSTMALVTPVFLFLWFTVVSLPAAAETNSPPTSQSSNDLPRLLHSWPSTLPRGNGTLLLQLSHSEKNIEASLVCEGRTVSLGVPGWTHELGLLHLFELPELDFVAGRRCRILATTVRGRTYEGTQETHIARRARPPKIVSMNPTFQSYSTETIVELVGTGLSEEVDVLWISTRTFRYIRRSARSEVLDSKQHVVLPIAPHLREGTVGEHLVVVQRSDGLGALAPTPYLVTPPLHPEVLESHLIPRGDRWIVELVGVDLEGVYEVSILFDGQTRNLPLEQPPGSSLSTLHILVPESVTPDRLARAHFQVRGGTVTWLLPGSSLALGLKTSR